MNRWDENEPLTAEDTDASDLSAAIETRELDMSSDEDQYDEETGLTAHQKRQRRRRRRQRRKLDARIADTKSSHGIFQLGLADRNVAKRLMVNAGLILMWYFFSLSISIVSFPLSLPACPQSTHMEEANTDPFCHYSTTNGCFPRATSSFLSLFSLPASTWPSNSPFPLFCYGSSHLCARAVQKARPRTPPLKRTNRTQSSPSSSTLRASCHAVQRPPSISASATCR